MLLAYGETGNVDIQQNIEETKNRSGPKNEPCGALMLTSQI